MCDIASIATTLRATWARAVALWEAWQVELHGKYSVERLVALRKHFCRTSAAHALLVMAVTPLPCLLYVVLMDLIPLQPPALGLAHSFTFCMRAFLTTWMMTFVALYQCRCLIAALPMTIYEIVVVTTVSACSSVTIAFGLASVIGYPLPFLLALGSPGCCTLLLIAGTAIWGRHIRGNAELQAKLKNYVLVATAQLSMTYIYPAYNFAFTSLSASAQTLFALLLPVVKVLVKNSLSQLLTTMEDFRPEMVVFNVEIFHALFVAYCMQTASSLSTTAVLMASDFVQACLSLRDVNKLLDALSELINDTDEREARTPVRSWLCRAFTKPTQVAPSPPVPTSSAPTTNAAVHERIALMDAALEQVRPTAPDFADIKSDDIRDGKDQLAASTRSQGRSAESVARVSSIVPIYRAAAGQTRRLTVHAKQRLDALSDETRLAFVTQLLQLLHLTESLLLIEFTEVIVPAIYCVYLSVISNMPNRQYYPNLRDLDDTTVHRNIWNVLLYALLEVLSFVLLTRVLSRKLRISSFQHLSFVLTTQWPMVQTKLILWVTFAVQSSLEHFGVDYTFRFKWLHHSTEV